MKELIVYLYDLGHALGIGGFEGVIGAIVIAMAALVIFVRSLSLLRRTGIAIQRDGQLTNPLEWMDDAEKTVGCDLKIQIESPSIDVLHIWHKRH